MDVPTVQRDRPPVALQANGRVFGVRAIGPTLGAGLDPIGLAGRDRQHPGHRLTAPDHRVRPAQQLDPLNARERQRAKVVVARGAGEVADLHPVDQHQHLIGIAAAHKQAGHPAQRPVAREGNPRQARQHTGQVRPLYRIDGGGGHNADRGGREVQRQRRSGDRDRAGVIRRGGQRGAGAQPGSKNGTGEKVKVALQQAYSRPMDETAVHGGSPAWPRRNPARLHPAHPVRSRNDHRRQVSWLSGSTRLRRLPGGPKHPVAYDGPLAGYSCGGSFDRHRTSRHPRIPFEVPCGTPVAASANNRTGPTFQAAHPDCPLPDPRAIPYSALATAAKAPA